MDENELTEGTEQTENTGTAGDTPTPVDPVLAAVKTDLGITSSRRDSEITTAITAAEHRLSMIGVGTVSTSDEVTLQAVKLYCRSWFNFQGDGDRYEQAFEKLANAMSHANEYQEGDDPA